MPPESRVSPRSSAKALSSCSSSSALSLRHEGSAAAAVALGLIFGYLWEFECPLVEFEEDSFRGGGGKEGDMVGDTMEEEEERTVLRRCQERGERQ